MDYNDFPMPPQSTAEQLGGLFTGEEGGYIAGAVSGVGDEIRRIREGFEEHLRAFHGQTKLLSEEEVQSQREFVEGILRNPKGNRGQMHRLIDDYASEEARRRREETIKLYAGGIRRLEEARRANVISRKSYDEWIGEWFLNRNLSAFEKTQSLRESLVKYLEERWALAREREKLLKDPRLGALTDAKLRAEVIFLKDDREYFEKHSFTQRKNLVDRVRAGLAVAKGGPEYQKLYDKAEKMLLDATKAPQPALHRDKVGTWLKRIFESGADASEIRAFLEGTGEGTLHKLIETWRNVAIQFWTLRKDPAFAGVKTQFINTKAFLWLHYDERVSYVAGMRGQVERARTLRARAGELITHAEHAGALDAAGRERWLGEYVFNGKFTLEELESIISGNLTERLENKVALVRRYERASDQAKRIKGIRGMLIQEKSAFLKLHYEKQLATVREMELRIDQVKRNKPDFLLIRHFMDREEWDAAQELIEETRKRGPLSFEDDGQLTSMERYIKLRSKEGRHHQGGVEATATEVRQVDQLLEDIGSPSLQRLCILLAERGSESISALGWTSYNRDWCNKHGYLNPKREHQAILRGKSEALAKARRRKRGVVSETIQGETGEQEYIELSRSAATNVCVDILDSGAMNAFAETLYRRRKDHRALYWTNTIFHRGGVLMDLSEQNEETRRMYKMRNLLRRLEAKGLHYQYRGTSQEVAKTITFPSGGKAEKVSKKAA